MIFSGKENEMKGNRNDLSVWKMGYFPWRFGNIIYNIKNFFRNFKFAWQRARYGYCDVDVWGLREHLLVLLRESLYKLANECHSYPPNYTDEEQWEKELRQAAEDCHYANFDNQPNEYADRYFEAIGKDLPNFDYVTLAQKAREVDANNIKDSVMRQERALAWIVEHFDHLWD